MNDDGDKSKPSRMTLQATVQQAGKKATRPPSPPPKDVVKTSLSWSDRIAWPGRIALLAAVILSPWAFGAFEYWAQCGIAIAILISMAFWWFETAMSTRKSQVFPYLFFPITGGLLLGLLQVVGLPDWLASRVLGRQIEIYSKFSGLTDYWPTISVNHEGTWGQISLLLIAISALLLGCRYFRSKGNLILLLTAMTLNGVALSFFGIVQKLSFNGKLYWVHEVTQGGSAFGPFVNRNNASGYLLICLACAIGLLPIVMSHRVGKGPQNLASKEMPFWRQFYYYLLEFIAELTATKLALLLGIILIATAVTATLSRGGVVAMLFAATATVIAYGMARKPKNSSFIFAPVILFAAAIAGWFSFGEEIATRFESVDLANVSETDLRIQHWQSTWPAVADNGLFGAGLGSYRGIHRLYRTDREQSVYHYAENQFFQSLVEAGWPGLILFLAAWFLAFQCASLALSRGSSPTTIGVGTMGMFLIFSQATVSLFDFSFYIPANMLALAVTFGFLAYHAQALSNRLKDQSWLRFQVPNYVVQVVVVVLFFAVVFVMVDLYGRSTVQNKLRPHYQTFTPDTLNIEETDAKLASLMPCLVKNPTAEGLNHGAALWIHRARLQLLEEMQSEPEYVKATDFMKEQEKTNFLANLWNLTNLQQLQENIYYLSQETKYGANEFRKKAAIKENLPIAYRLLTHSREQTPIQPWVHLRLAQISAVIKKTGEGDIHMRRAVELAPSNANFRLVAAIYYLQSGNPEKSAPHIKRYLELKPASFPLVLDLLNARTNRSIAPVDPKMIVEKMLPDNPHMLFILATDYFPDGSNDQVRILDRSAALVESAEIRVHRNLVLLGDIRLKQGDKKAAIEQYSSALLTRPTDRDTRFKRAQLHLEFGELDDALEDADYILDHGRKSKTNKNFQENIERLIEDRERQKRERFELRPL